MSNIPKCISWLGHKFEGRYSLDPVTDAKLSDYNVADMSEALFYEMAQLRQRKTYERDICVRCGATVEKKS